jgi:predicted N-formylglutamate amidohydrolase
MADDPPAVTVVNEDGQSPLVLLCEHASNHIPPRYAGLGLPPAALARHIAYDIGAAEVARHLAARLDAVLVLSGYSRLLIDCNRPLDAPSSIPAVSEATVIPGNRDLSPAERAERDRLYFAPFRARAAALLESRLAAGRPTALIGIHSFTPVFLGVRRPWHVGVLYRHAHRLAAALRQGFTADPALIVGVNEPYRVTAEGDYTVPWLGEARGIATALIELRQDLIGAPPGAAAWAERLAAMLARLAGETPALARLAPAAT